MKPEELISVNKAAFEKQLLKQARKLSIVLGLSGVISIGAITYGIIQNIETGTQRDAAIKNEQSAIEWKLEADTLHQRVLDLEKQLAQCQAMPK